MFVNRRSVLAATAALLVGCATTANAEEASAFLSETHRVIHAVLKNDQHSPEVKRALIESILNERLDLSTMSRLALGRQEESFSRTELSEFIQEYSRFLNYTYLREISWVDPENLPTIESSVVDEKTGWVTVSTKSKARKSLATRRGQFRRTSSFRSEFLMRKRHGSWRIAKIRFDGVDLNSAFGSQFKTMLRESTPEEVLAKLRDLNTQRGADNPLEPK